MHATSDAAHLNRSSSTRDSAEECQGGRKENGQFHLVASVFYFLRKQNGMIACDFRFMTVEGGCVVTPIDMK